MTLEVIVTSGGVLEEKSSICPIINLHKEDTGTNIAEEFLRRGHRVHFVYTLDSKTPFRASLVIDPSKPFEEEMGRVKIAHDEHKAHSDRLHEYPVGNFDDYYRTVRLLLTGKSPDVVVLASALYDYGILPDCGKSTSNGNCTLELELLRNPKLISVVKQWNPEVFQVGFKLLSKARMEDLVEKGHQSGVQNHSNLTIASSLMNGEHTNRVTAIITPEKGVIPAAYPQMASRLVDIVTTRASRNRYHTKLTTSPSYLDEMSNEVSALKAQVERFWYLNLFDELYRGANLHFGFVATRIPQGGFLITSNDSNKKKISSEDIVYIPSVDFNQRVVTATSSGKNTSLNASVVARVFEQMPHINMVLHSHICLPVPAKTSADYAPGTQENMDEIMRYLGAGHKILELVNQGIIAVGANSDEIIALLGSEHIYTQFPELYDQVYGRLQSDRQAIDCPTRIDDFFGLIYSGIAPESTILDLAAGTGELSRQLLQDGYLSVALAEKHPGMLEIAKAKIEALTMGLRAKDVKVGEIPMYITCMENMDLGQKYDAIVVRGAINHLVTYEILVQGLRKMHEHLNPQGRLVFNALNGDGPYKHKPRFVEYDDQNLHIKISQMNLAEEKMLTSTHNCTFMEDGNPQIKRVYDLNRLRLFTSDEFKSALMDAGFGSVSVYGRGLGSHPFDNAGPNIHTSLRQGNSKIIYVVGRMEKHSLRGF